MASSRIVPFVALLGLALHGVATAPVHAGEPRACNPAKANVFMAAGDRFEAHGRYADATRWYVAASRETRDCAAAADVLVGSRSLAKAGSALALSGEYLKAGLLLHDLQARLEAVAAGADSQSATAARALSDRVRDLISAIDRVAQSTM